MTTNPKLTAHLAELDQRHAEAKVGLAKAIKDYRERVDGTDESAAFAALVLTVGDLVDPDDVLDAEHSHRLILVAECFACAVTKPTKILRVGQFAATIALYMALTHTPSTWWLWAITITWGLVTGAWGFSAGWDARQ